MNAIIRNWWVTNGERDPIGPVSTELLVEGIKAGKVPAQVWVCLVGETSWRKLTDLPEFLAAVTNASKKRSRRAPAMDAESTIIDQEPLPESENYALPLRAALPRPQYDSGEFDDEKTIVDSTPPQSGHTV